MNPFALDCNSCQNDCGNPCNGCGPAHYDHSFSITASPFDPTTWNVHYCGKMFPVKIPQIAETDTTLSTNYSNATLNYNSERHVDTTTGAQLGALINVGDLRDVEADYDTDAMCYELVYHKYGECGEGCQSVENRWTTFSIDSQNALANQLKYVRGANVYGCPQFLDVPSNTSQYWLAGWRGNGQFGYMQPRSVTQLPTTTDGTPIAVSQDPATKEPIVGPIQIKQYLQTKVCSYFDPAPGFTIASGANSICYYPNQDMANIVLDLLCTTARPAQVCADVVVATIHDPSFWPNLPTGGYIDLPLHCVYQNNTDAKITPIWLRIDQYGQVLVTGEMTARPTAGKAAYMVLGVDDSIAWPWKG